MPAMRGIAVAAALVATAACSSGGGLDDKGPTALPTTAPVTVDASPTPTPSSAATATPAPPPAVVDVRKYPRDPAVQAFADFITARTAALRRRDTRYAPLIAITTRNRHPIDRERIARMVSNDEVFEGTPRYVVIAAATTATTSRIRACQRDDASWFLNRKTGKRSEVKPIWTSHDVRMVSSGGTWKVDGVYAANFSCGEAR